MMNKERRFSNDDAIPRPQIRQRPALMYFATSLYRDLSAKPSSTDSLDSRLELDAVCGCLTDIAKNWEHHLPRTIPVVDTILFDAFLGEFIYYSHILADAGPNENYAISSALRFLQERALHELRYAER